MASISPRPPLLPWSPTTWERWSAQGRLSSSTVPRTPFLLLKAPVSTVYEQKIGGDRHMFTVGMFCSRMMARSIRVGLVVDCTALDLEEFEPLPARVRAVAGPQRQFDRRVRYFHNPSEWDEYDVDYHRLLPPKSGDDTSPLAPQVLPEFYRTITNFVQKSRTENSKICIALFDSRGGLGAAAYLAACYMCQTLRAPVHAALEALKEGTPMQTGDNNSDRKWGIFDARLVKDVQTRFKGRKELRIEGGTPGWWWAVEEDEEDDEDGENDDSAKQNEGKEGATNKKRSREEAIIIPPCDSSAEKGSGAKRARTDTGNGVVAPGSSLYPDLPKEILVPIPRNSPNWKRALTVLSQMTTTPSSQSSDPTAMTTLPLKPEVNVSAAADTDADLLQFIQTNSEKYKVTWLSTRGRRGLLLLLAEAVYFLEQSSASSIAIFTVTGIKFPTPTVLAKTQHRTLLDVVLVKDVEKNKAIYRFYALDILCIEGGMVWHKPFSARWRFLNENVLIPRKKDEAEGASHVYAREPIKIRAKEYFPMAKLGFVMKDVSAGVGHAAEGVRVVPVGAYGIGSEGRDRAESLVWRRGGKVEDEQLKALLLK